MYPGGRAFVWLAALVLLLGACGGSDGGVSSDGDRSGDRDRSDAVQDGDGDGSDDDDGSDGDDEVAAASTTTSSTTTTATTTTVPPTTAASTTTTSTTTQPPPPPPAPPATAAPPAPSGPQHGTRNTGCEQYMHDQINAARRNAGRGGLQFDTGIQYIAVAWSDQMAGSQTLSHNPDYGDQIVQHRDYRTAGENVGRGYEQGSLFQAFMNSPAHRANIESDAYSHVTVGCLTDAGGQLWVTQNFWGG